MVVVLAGGVGAARFLDGLVQVMPQEEITVVVNTGDDRTFFGLHVSPDLDINLYTLAGAVHPEQGWGLAGETFHVLRALERYGHETWFNLGDKDLATHLHRTWRLQQGARLSEIAAELARAWNLTLTILPMSDDPVQTYIRTPQGEMHFQEYLVKHKAAPEVLAVTFRGADAAAPAPGVLAAIERADAIIVAPSNPIVSIGTILAVPGIATAIAASPAPKIAVSPIIGGKPVKGPADRLMPACGYESSALGVAQCYVPWLQHLVIDRADAELAPAIEALGVKTHVTDTLMTDRAARRRLAQFTLDALAQAGSRARG